jgi:hypothetical protein
MTQISEEVGDAQPTSSEEAAFANVDLLGLCTAQSIFGNLGPPGTLRFSPVEDSSTDKEPLYPYVVKREAVDESGFGGVSWRDSTFVQTSVPADAEDCVYTASHMEIQTAVRESSLATFEDSFGVLTTAGDGDYHW